MPSRPRFAAWPLAAAASLHLMLIAFVLMAVHGSGKNDATTTLTKGPAAPTRLTRVVFLPATAPGSGGGGGGNRQTGPVRRAESRGTDPITLRMQTPDKGLDDEAVKAVRQWKFAPGRLNGAPVDVLVTVILDFAMR